MTTESIPKAPRSRGVFCNRTLNLRAIKAVGYDMDYTLIDYRAEAWELAAYEHLRRDLVNQGWPMADYHFDPDLVARGLVIDLELGNIVKANRFGYVKKALHGTRPLDFDAQRETYARVIVDLGQPRWVFLNTLFSLSEGCLYLQSVDLLDEGKLPIKLGYAQLYNKIHARMDAAHMEGELKARIVAAPEKFVRPDPETPLALLDQRAAGKKLMLITNSEWEYTQSMMSYAFDSHLPPGKKWRDLFDVVIIAAGKPGFFLGRAPLFEVVSADGLLRPAISGIKEGGIFLGGSAGQVERHLGLSGDEILYVGDHMWGDVHVSKSALRWRTALVLRELEEEIEALDAFAASQRQLDEWMGDKERLEARQSELRLLIQRRRQNYGPAAPTSISKMDEENARLRSQLASLDDKIGPLAQAAGELGHKRWGPLMRTGNDKSHLARQMENYADIYTSRVSNLLFTTPFAFLRSEKGRRPHDPG